MAKFKVKFVLNKGRKGAPLGKLGMIAEQAEKFLTALASECDVKPRPGEWLAVDFENGSVQYNAEFQGEIPPGAAEIFSKKLEYLADFDPETDGLNGVVGETAAIEYARIGALIDPDEVIGLGIYSPRGGPPKMRQISYRRSAEIKRQLELAIPSYGAIQGVIHAWFKEAKEPYFTARELSTSVLVKVLYKPSDYTKVVSAVRHRTTILIASGMMRYDKVSQQALEMRADRIDVMGSLSPEAFQALAGSAPEVEFDLGDETYLSDVA